MRTIVNIFKVLSDENRLKILFALGEKELCTCEMSHFLKVTNATVSSHLKQLRQAGLVDYKKDGKWVIYFLTPTKENSNLFQYLKSINKDNAKNKQLMSEIGELDRVTICKIKQVKK